MAELPPNVRTCGAGYRAVVSRGGRRIYGPTRETVADARADVLALRACTLTLRDGLALVEDDLALIGASSETLRYYRAHLRPLERLLGAGRVLATIRARDVAAFIRERQADGISASTISGKELQVLDRICELARRCGELEHNPVRAVRKPRARAQRFDWIPGEEVCALLAAIRAWPGVRTAARDADIIELAYRTGLRRAELARLRRADLDLAAGRIFVRGKTDDRYVPIAAAAREPLLRLAATGDPLIGSMRLVEKLFARWRVRLAEPRLTPHTIRHSFGSALARAGVDPYTLRDLMGHQTLTMAMRYVHSHGDRARAAVDALDLRPGSHEFRELPRRADGFQ